MVDSSHCQYFQHFPQKTPIHNEKNVEIYVSELLISGLIIEYQISRIRRSISVGVFPLTERDRHKS
jgi:hypothetical protein